MKFFIYFLIVLFAGINVQGQCLTNGTFATACDNEVFTSFNDCPTWTDGTNGTNSCGAGWVRSQGSPQMKKTIVYYEGGSDTIHYAYMFARYDGYGEGIFTPYTFQMNQGYKLRFTYAEGGTNGTVNVYAASGLQQNIVTGCGNLPPNIYNKQLIGQFAAVVSSNQQQVTLTFLANANYSQLWIYPSAALGQTDLNLYSVEACPSCATNTLNYNTGVIPSGTSSAGYINVGSSAGSGGSGTVTVTAGNNTYLVANQQVNLLPSFSATTTGSGSLTIFTAPCVPDQQINGIAEKYARMNIPVQFDYSDPTESRPAVNPMVSDEIRIFPSISSGLVHITGSNKVLTNANITVCDAAGQNVYKTRLSGDNHNTLNLGKLTNGIYFIQLQNGSQIITQKIIINK